MNSAELFRRLETVKPDQFGNLFKTMQTSAFRLEMLDFYTIPGEEEEFRQWKSGQKVPPEGSNQKWIDTVSASVKRGVDFQRVRLVREPVSEYLKFEVAWGYRLNIPAGEKTSCIFYKDKPAFTSQIPILKDFWLFDEERCYLLEYDFVGRFLGLNQVPSDHVAGYCELKKELLSRANDIRKTPLWDFAQL